MRRLNLMLVVLALLCGGMSFAAAPTSQDAPAVRGRVRGAVRTADGKPWKGAHVILVSSFHDDLGGDLPSDVLTVRSDGRGRFAASVLRGRGYSVWARSEPENGEFRCTALIEGAHAGSLVRLRESGPRQRQVHVNLLDRELWKDREPLRFQICTTMKNPWVVDVKASKGDAAGSKTTSFVLPPLPGAQAYWQVRDKDGHYVMTQTIGLLRHEQHDGVGPPPPLLIKMHKRIPYLIRITGKKSKKPKVGARVYQRIGYREMHGLWMLAGMTDEDGYAALSVTRNQDLVNAATRQHLWFKVQDDHVPIQQFGRAVTLNAKRDIAALRKKKKPDYSFKCFDESCTVRGRVLLAKGEPAAKQKLIFYPSYGNPTARSLYLNFEPTIFETDAEGRFETSGWGPRFAYRLCMMPGERAMQALPRSREFPLAPLLVLATGVAEGQVDLGEIVLDQLRPVDIEVTKADGFPAAGAEVALAEASNGFEFRTTKGKVERIQLSCSRPLRASLGRSGKQRWLIPDTEVLNACVNFRGAWKLQPLEPSKRAAEKLQLTEPIYLSGRIINGSGKPIPRAMVQVNPMRYPAGFNARLASLFVNRKIYADADGRFKIGLPFTDTQYYVWGRIQIGTKWYNTQQTNMVSVDEGEKPDPVELEIPVPDASLPGAKKKPEKKSK